MKKAYLLCIFLSSWAGAKSENISQSTCLWLSGRASIIAFSPDSQSTLYAGYPLMRSEMGTTFIQAVRVKLKAQLDSLCKSASGVEYEDFLQVFHSGCSSECQSNTWIFSPASNQRAGDLVCISICNQTYEKLQYFEKGYLEGSSQKP